MSISTNQIGKDKSNYQFGTGDSLIASGSVDRSYTVNIDVVDGNGQLTDIIYGGQEDKISVTKFASTVDSLGGSISFAGVTGYVTKSSVIMSNEDVTKVQTEALSAPALSSGSGNN